MPSGDFTPKVLSGSASGKPIAVAGTTSGTATTIHTPTTVSPDLEYVTLYAANINAAGATRLLTIEWGATGVGNGWPVKLAPDRGMVLIADRVPIIGAAQVIKAFVDVANEVNIVGRVTKAEAPT